MKKNRLLYILLAFLIIANGFFLFNYMGKGNNKGRGPQNPGGFIIKELGFNKKQLSEFRESNQGHHKTMIGLSDDIRNLKDELFSSLFVAELLEHEIDSMLTIIANKEMEKEKEALYHFKRIQNICNDKQKEKFKKIIIDALYKSGGRNQRPPRFGGPEGGKPPRKEGFEGHKPPPRHE